MHARRARDYSDIATVFAEAAATLEELQARQSVTVKEELHQLVDLLADEDAKEALDYLRWLTAGSETLSAEELAQVAKGEDEITRGEYVTLAELKRSMGD